MLYAVIDRLLARIEALENAQPMNPADDIRAARNSCRNRGSVHGLQMDLAKLKGRVITLEQREGEVKQMLGELLTAIQEVKLLLARNGME